MRPVLPALALLLALGSPLPAQNVDVEEFHLDNGMTWLLVPRHEEPNTVSLGWVAKVGSVNERPGITGISHFFEHMMFKGTKTVGTRDPAADAASMAAQKRVKDAINAIVWGQQYTRFLRGEIDDPWDARNDTPELRELRAELKRLMDEHKAIIEKNEFDSIYTNGGASGLNAFTSEDLTFYVIALPSNKLELFCWMESDRLIDSVFREFYSERDVVHEERRMRLESDPTGKLDETFDAMFWQSSPYSWSVVGWPYDLNSYTREDFDAYFNVYYRPNNLVGVAVGDFDPEAFKPMLVEYFGRIPRGEKEPPPVVTLEMPQTGEKRLNGECECQPQVEVRYHTVPFAHADEYPLQVMTELLNGRTGRLYKAMVEGAEIATSARASQDGRKYAGMFSFRAQVKGDATPADLEQAWYAELAKLQTEPVGERELQKVKNQVAADAFRSLQSNDFIRLQVGYSAGLGDWREVNASTQKLLAVTPDDVLRVANTYFDRDNRAVATYLRKQGAAPDELAAFSGEEREQIQSLLAQLDQVPAEALSSVIDSIESQFGDMPAEVRPAMEYVVAKLRARVAAAEGK